MNHIYKKIDEIPQCGLCTSCGTCAGLCPTEALAMHKDHNGLYIPVLDGSKCNECNLCLKVCPGHSVDFKEINREIFNRMPDNPIVGNALNFYSAYSSDSDIRLAGQSGGVVSSLLIFALEEKLIDGAILTKMRKEDPLTPEPFIAESKKDIISASKSKYCPVPLNMIIKQVLRKTGRFAIVGIPCQIQGIRKAERIRGSLKKKIILHFGLFCDSTQSFLFQDYILFKICAERQAVKEFIYRSKEWRGWPGDLLIRLKNGETATLSKEWKFNLKPFFTPQRCYTCFDKLNELADVSFGDAWLRRFKYAKEGVSILITRTKNGDEIIRRAIRKGVIKAQNISIEDVIKAQRPQEKKLLLDDHLHASKFTGGDAPKYDVRFFKTASNNTIGELLALLDIRLCNIPKRPHEFRLLKYTPLLPLELISFIRRKLASLAINGKKIENPYRDENQHFSQISN